MPIYTRQQVYRERSDPVAIGPPTVGAGQRGLNCAELLSRGIIRNARSTGRRRKRLTGSIESDGLEVLVGVNPPNLAINADLNPDVIANIQAGRISLLVHSNENLREQYLNFGILFNDNVCGRAKLFVRLREH